jgi:DNA-binding Xre family transcriptional regulator
MRTNFARLLNDKRKRDNKRYPLAHVARLTHISRSTLHYWNKGHIQNINGAVLDRLCYWLVCTPSDLLLPDIPQTVQKP